MRTATPSPVLAVVPTLDALADDPSRVAALPVETVRALYARMLVCQAALTPRLLTAVGAASGPPLPPPGPEWITAAQVREQFGLDALWLAEHRRGLQQCRIVSSPSRKVRLYSVARLRRFIEQQAEPVR
jgi:hypothetical protein